MMRSVPPNITGPTERRDMAKPASFAAKNDIIILPPRTTILLTLSRARALFGTTCDFIEWAWALFGTVSNYRRSSTRSSGSGRLGKNTCHIRGRLVLH